MESLGSATVASLTKQVKPAKKKDTLVERNARIALYHQRVMQGLDIWTGEPLRAKPEQEGKD